MFKVFLNVALTLILGRLKVFVLETVEKYNAETITNEEKRDLAFTEIKSRAAAEGKTLRDSLINLVREIAVTLLKK